MRISIIFIIIFLVNCVFYEGKIIFEFGFIRISDEGLINGLEKSGLLIALFFFTGNVFNEKNKKIIDYYLSKNNNLFSKSIRYFYSFLEILKMELSINRIIFFLIRKRKLKEFELTQDITYSRNDYILFAAYNLSAIMIFIILYVFFNLIEKNS